LQLSFIITSLPTTRGLQELPLGTTDTGKITVNIEKLKGVSLILEPVCAFFNHCGTEIAFLENKQNAFFMA